MDIDVWFEPDHVFPVTLAFRVVTSDIGGSDLVRWVLVFIEENLAFNRGTREPVIRVVLADSLTEVM